MICVKGLSYNSLNIYNTYSTILHPPTESRILNINIRNSLYNMRGFVGLLLFQTRWKCFGCLIAANLMECFVDGSEIINDRQRVYYVG